MTIRILILIICFSFYSCATLINNKQTRIEIHSIPDSASICLDNDSCVISPVILEVPRNYNDFSVVVKNDSIEKPIRIKSRVAPEFMWGNLLFVYYSPIGYIVDASSRQKTYSYDNSLLVNLSDKTRDYQKWEPSKKGQFYIRSSFPWFDFIEFDNGRGFDNYKSYMGLTLGIDYYHSKHSFLSLSGGATGISDIAFPVMDKWVSDTVQFVNSFSAKLTNNHDLNIFSSKNIDFTLGYGLSFTNFRYRQIFKDSIQSMDVELYKKAISTVGFCADANVILFKYFYAGLSVLPSFYTLKRNKWEYSYLAYFDFGIRLPLGNYKDDKIKVIKYKPKLLE